MVFWKKLDDMAHKVLDDWKLTKTISVNYQGKGNDLEVFNTIKSITSDLLVTQKRGRVAKHNKAVEVEGEYVTGFSDPNRVVLAVYINLNTNASYMDDMVKRLESNAKLWNSEGPTLVKDMITDMFHCAPQSIRIFWKRMEFDTDERQELKREPKYVHAHFPYDVSLDFDRLKSEFGDDIKIWSDPENRKRRYCIYLSEIVYPDKRIHNNSSMDDILEQHVHGRSAVLKFLREILSDLDENKVITYDVSKCGFSAVLACKDDETVKDAKQILRTYLETAGEHDFNFQFGEFVPRSDEVANQVFKHMKEQVNVTMENRNDKIRFMVCKTFLDNCRTLPPPQPPQHHGHMPPTPPHITPISVEDSTLSALASTAPSESDRTSVSGRTDMSTLKPLWQVLLTEENIGKFKSDLKNLNRVNDLLRDDALFEMGPGDDQDHHRSIEDFLEESRKRDLDHLIERHTMTILNREFPDWKTSMDVQSRKSLVGFINSNLREVEGESRQ